jgi:hypothetical protein
MEGIGPVQHRMGRPRSTAGNHRLAPPSSGGPANPTAGGAPVRAGRPVAFRGRHVRRHHPLAAFVRAPAAGRPATAVASRSIAGEPEGAGQRRGCRPEPAQGGARGGQRVGRHAAAGGPAGPRCTGSTGTKCRTRPQGREARARGSCFAQRRRGEQVTAVLASYDSPGTVNRSRRENRVMGHRGRESPEDGSRGKVVCGWPG